MKKATIIITSAETPGQTKLTFENNGWTQEITGTAGQDGTSNGEGDVVVWVYDNLGANVPKSFWESVPFKRGSSTIVYRNERQE
jgi:hypothetical protein